MEKPSGFYYFKTKPIILPSKHDLWRGVADSLGFKTHERLRVECLPAGGAGMIFYTLDPAELNPRLTKWLIEYNFNRPHQSLDYLTPIEYIEKELIRIRDPSKVLPMWSASTKT